jgi:D-alanyl-D-alanine dipeptidase
VDSGNSASKLGSFALRSMLAAQRSAPLPEFAKSDPVTGEDAKRLSGWFTNGKTSVVTRIFEDHLVIDAPELVGDIRRAGNRYLVEDAQSLADGLAFAPDGSWLELGGVRYARTDWPQSPAPPADFAPLIGEYGWQHNILRIYERDGQPFVRIEWTDYRPLTRVDADTYAFPTDRGLYPLEQLRFERDAKGAVLAARLGGIRFPHRDFGAEVQALIRSGVKANMKDLRNAALKAVPPLEPPAPRTPDLVALDSLDPSIKLDIRYAGFNNFMGVPLYERSDALLQRPAAEAIVRASQALHAKGYGLLIHDAYRPWFVTKMFWDATPPASRVFVADPAHGSRHNRGSAVDLTLYDLKTGTPLVMTGRYDESSSRSFSNYVGGSDLERWQRDLLRSAIESKGFDVYPQEWWHFDYTDWRDYPIGNVSFQELDRGKRR